MKKIRKQKLLLLGILSLVLTSCSVSVATFTPTPQPPAIATTTATTTPILTTQISSSTSTATTSVVITSAYSPTAAIVPTFTPVIAPTPTPEIYDPTTATTSTMQPTPTNVVTIVATPKLLGTATPIVFQAGANPDAEEQKFIQLLNAYRQSNGLNALTFDDRLFQSSSWMAKDMATKNYVSHTDSLKRDIPTRIHDFGYLGPIVGENIAGGFANAQDNLNIWQSDQIHKDNLLGKYYKHVGVSRYYEANSLNKWYWVLDMGG